MPIPMVDATGFTFDSLVKVIVVGTVGWMGYNTQHNSLRLEAIAADLTHLDHAVSAIPPGLVGQLEHIVVGMDALQSRGTNLEFRVLVLEEHQQNAMDRERERNTIARQRQEDRVAGPEK